MTDAENLALDAIDIVGAHIMINLRTSRREMVSELARKIEERDRRREQDIRQEYVE